MDYLGYSIGVPYSRKHPHPRRSVVLKSPEPLQEQRRREQGREADGRVQGLGCRE